MSGGPSAIAAQSSPCAKTIALRALTERRDSRNLWPGDEALAEALRLTDSPEETDALMNYLFPLLSEEAGRGRIARLLALAEAHKSTALGRLRSAAGGAHAGASAVCELCSVLPRAESWTHATSVSEKGARFPDLLPALAENTCDAKADFVRQSAVRALEKAAHGSPEGRDLVLAALRRCVAGRFALTKDFRRLLSELGGTLQEGANILSEPKPPPQDAFRDFVDAAGNGDLAAVRLGLQGGMPVDVPSDDGSTALCAAAREGQRDVAEFLLDMGADANHRGGADLTPLMNAVLSGHPDVAELLLDRGALVTSDLLSSVRLKVNILKENAATGMVLSEAVRPWQQVLKALARARELSNGS